ncbi:MAG: hypothetical protein LBS20_11700 [Prevotella sp.]|jgi:hypothetical protein|nr:hypothetical protein [Prevotella sp.]
MKAGKLKPLFISGDIPRPLFVSYPEDCGCNTIDLIFRFLTNEIGRESLPPELRDMTLDELQAEYNRHFPAMAELEILS